MKLLITNCAIEMTLPDKLEGLTDCLGVNGDIKLATQIEVDDVVLKTPEGTVIIKKLLLKEMRGSMIPFIDGNMVRWFTLEGKK